ncbi:hypothetical protein CDAR_195501 [Caerostris darwini]|uniref:Uncharacterized protein n=1 Tax=Caerostris darwini TaxID=1538125 RepID=A0AAV4NE44_9ARAC|nr:hypothetical protein CDAR_195501 [Caerostris darwini]
MTYELNIIILLRYFKRKAIKPYIKSPIRVCLADFQNWLSNEQPKSRNLGDTQGFEMTELLRKCDAPTPSSPNTHNAGDVTNMRFLKIVSFSNCENVSN